MHRLNALNPFGMPLPAGGAAATFPAAGDGSCLLIDALHRVLPNGSLMQPKLMLNPFDMPLPAGSAAATFPAAGDGSYWIIDAPGINGMGANSKLRIQKHLAAGGQILHRVLPNGSLAQPKLMRPTAAAPLVRD